MISTEVQLFYLFCQLFQVSKPTAGFLRQLYNAYKGTGSVYVIVASVNNSKSAYVPIISYACDIRTSSNNCEGPCNIFFYREIIIYVYNLFSFFSDYSL